MSDIPDNFLHEYMHLSIKIKYCNIINNHYFRKKTIV